MRLVLLPVLYVFDAGGARPIEQHARRMRAGNEIDIAALHRRPEIGDGGAGASAVADRVLQAAEALLLGGVEIVDLAIAELRGRCGEGVPDRVRYQILARLQRAGIAAIEIAAFLVALGAFEIGQHVGEGPALQPHLRQPVVIDPVTADISHDVDRGRAADHFPARMLDAAIVEMRFGLAQIIPIPARIVPDLADAQRQMDQPVLVFAARFEHEDAVCAVFAEPRRQHATGRAGADDDGVVICHDFLFSPPAPAAHFFHAISGGCEYNGRIRAGKARYARKRRHADGQG